MPDYIGFFPDVLNLPPVVSRFWRALQHAGVQLSALQ
jgi:hypothetical protein